MTGLGPLIWRFCAVIADIMTATGLVGLVILIFRGLVWLTDKLIYEEELSHDDY